MSDWKQWVYWEPPWIGDVIISSIVGAIVGIVAGHYTDAFSRPPPKSATIWTNELGQARPMMTLIPPLKRENKIAIRFDPPELEQVVVCEFSHVTGESASEVVLSYLGRYPMCFVVTEKSENAEWVVRPNVAQQQIKRLPNGQWSCLCG
jgi:hypothetical protein